MTKAPIEVIDSRNRHIYRDVIEDMFEMRFKVGKRYNWSIPYKTWGRDEDEFDTDKTIYFVSRDDDGRVVGTARLNPTSGPHMLNTVFREYCALEPIPSSPDVWEFSRMFVDRDRTTLKGTVTLSYVLMSAVAEFAVANRLSAVTWYTSMPNYSAALACWRKTRPIGRPSLHKSYRVIYVPAISPLDVEALRLIKQKAKLEGPVSAYTAPSGRTVLARDHPLIPQAPGGLRAA